MRSTLPVSATLHAVILAGPVLFAMPPTFHEIRSLLYAEQGIDAQALLGHKSPDMTALCRDVRGSEWIEIRSR
ncbi:exported hypothetical protein [Magnetospirillum sp. SS-4]|nr:exported hypothetical protein [Magnetospirillum sp. SS-4]